MQVSTLVDEVTAFAVRASSLAVEHYTSLRDLGVESPYFWCRDKSPYVRLTYSPALLSEYQLPIDLRSDPLMWSVGHYWYFEVPVDVIEGTRSLEQWIEDTYNEYVIWEQKRAESRTRYVAEQKAREQRYYLDLKRKMDEASGVS